MDSKKNLVKLHEKEKEYYCWITSFLREEKDEECPNYMYNMKSVVKENMIRSQVYVEHFMMKFWSNVIKIETSKNI